MARPAPAVALRRIDLTGLDEATRDAEVTRLRTEEGEAPFDLAADPMLRGALLTLGPQDHVLLLTFHHIAFDGWSMPVFMRDLRAAYAACRDGRTPSRSPVGSHAAHALAERARLTEDRLAVLRDFWSRRLDGLRSLELPVARRPVSPSHAGRHLDFTIDAGLSAQLTALCRTAGTTLHIVLLAALQALLAREAGQDDVAVAVPVALRDRPGAADEIGFFVNTLVMRTDLAGVLTVGQLIERVGRASLDAYDHRDMPFDRLVAELRPAREPGRTPFADVVFQLTDAWDGPMDLVGIEDERLAPQSLRARFDLEWHVRRSESTLLGTITYKADLFDNAYVRRLVDGFRAILGNMAEGVDSQLPAGMSQEAMTRSPTRRVQTGPPPTPHPGSEPRTEVEAQLVALWSEALQVPRVGIHDDFFALGGHSLLIAETAEALREVIGAEVPLHEIYTHPTIAGLLSAIDTPRSVDGSRTDPPPRAGLVPLRRGSADPLVLIHPASGLAAPYLPLVDTLHERESIYALEHPGPAHRSIRELAKHHVRLLRAAQGSGPHRLGGWSFGGLVAWEMACQLARAGQTVELLVLFDSFLPGAEAIVTDPVALIPHFLRDFGFDTPPVSAAGTAPSLVDALLREVYTELASRGGPPPTPGFDAFRRHFTVYTHSVAAAAEYGASTGYDGPIEFFRATRGANGARATDGWTRAHSGAFRTHDVAGTHHDMLRRPAVEDVGSTLQAILDRARRSDSAGTS